MSCAVVVEALAPRAWDLKANDLSLLRLMRDLRNPTYPVSNSDVP